MSDDIHTFTVTDRDGEPHDYRTTLHSARDAMELQRRLSKAIADPLWDLLVRSGGDLDIDSAELAGMGTSIRSTIQQLVDAKLVGTLLENTDRDDLPLHNDEHFDAAYRGNLDEMWRAVWEVVKVNGFLPFTDTLTQMANGMGNLPQGEAASS